MTVYKLYEMNGYSHTMTPTSLIPLTQGSLGTLEQVTREATNELLHEGGLFAGTVKVTGHADGSISFVYSQSPELPPVKKHFLALRLNEAWLDAVILDAWQEAAQEMFLAEQITKLIDRDKFTTVGELKERRAARNAARVTCSRACRVALNLGDLGVERPAIPDPSFTSGVGGFGPPRRAPQVSYSVFRDFSEEVTDFLDQTGETYSFTMGTQPGKMVNICIPNGRVLEYPGRGDEDGSVTSSVTVVSNYYDGDTGATAADQSGPVDSDFRISFT